MAISLKFLPSSRSHYDWTEVAAISSIVDVHIFSGGANLRVWGRRCIGIIGALEGIADSLLREIRRIVVPLKG